jgi:hypothetical protein
MHCDPGSIEVTHGEMRENIGLWLPEIGVCIVGQMNGGGEAFVFALGGSRTSG